eukprot:362982-Amorphochlora_amoeboformis.AAC.1
MSARDIGRSVGERWAPWYALSLDERALRCTPGLNGRALQRVASLDERSLEVDEAITLCLAEHGAEEVVVSRRAVYA